MSGISGGAPAATAAEMAAATDSFKRATPANLVSHKGVVPAWAYFLTAGTVVQAFNVASVTKTETGTFQVTMSAAMADANYAVLIAVRGSYGSYVTTYTTQNTTTFTVRVCNGSNGELVDPTSGLSVLVLGAMA